jgi:hypothetical protein
MMVGTNLTKVHFKHIWKCHSVIPHTTEYINKNFKFFESRKAKIKMTCTKISHTLTT